MFFIAEIPPSTFITCPVMNEAESERRKAAASAISFASPILLKDDDLPTLLVLLHCLIVYLQAEYLLLKAQCS